MSTPKNIQGAKGKVLFFDRAICADVILSYPSVATINIKERDTFIKIYLNQTAGSDKMTGTMMARTEIKSNNINFLLLLSKKTEIGR